MLSQILAGLRLFLKETEHGHMATHTANDWGDMIEDEVLGLGSNDYIIELKTT